MNAVQHLDYRRIYVYINSVWTDLTAYLLTVPAIELRWGFADIHPINSLLAETGSLTFSLDNRLGYFTPEGPSMWTGWRKGLPTYLEVSYQSRVFRRFYGTIADIVFDAIRFGSRVNVSVVDWIDYAARFPLLRLPILLNKTADTILNDMVAQASVKPKGLALDVGDFVFPYAYHSTTPKTRALSEMKKLVDSEMGRVYVSKDREQGETLKFERFGARHAWRPLTQLPVSIESPSFLLKANSPTDYVLRAGSTKDRIILALVEAAKIEDLFLEGKVSVQYGRYIVNRVNVTAYPSRVDATDQVLFTLQEPVPIGSGQTVVIRGNYSNPAGGGQVNGINMVNPVANVDYKAWQYKDASGTDITASLTVTPNYYASSFEHTVYNASTSISGYITTFKCRGRGIYFENTLSIVVEDEVSTESHGEQSTALDQKYQRSLSGQGFANSVIFQQKDPHAELISVEFNANSSSTLMSAFLLLDVGDLVHIVSALANIDDWYYIQRVEVSISEGDLIMVKWFLVFALSMLSGSLSPLAIEFQGPTSENAVDFGVVPTVQNLPKRTFSVWVYPDTNTGNQDIVSLFGESAGILLRVYGAGSTPGFATLQVRSKMRANLDIWYWNDVLTLGQWSHVVFTYDVNGVGSEEDPKLYVNGVLQTVSSKTLTGSPPMEDESALVLIAGNENTASFPYTSRGFDGKEKDLRVYNRLLSLGEVQALYNGGTPNMQVLIDNGLRFQAFAYPTKNASLYIDQSLVESSKVLDTMFKVVGTPHALPIGRTP